MKLEREIDVELSDLRYFETSISREEVLRAFSQPSAQPTVLIIKGVSPRS